MKYGTGEKYDSGVFWKQLVSLFSMEISQIVFYTMETIGGISGYFGLGGFGLGYFGIGEESGAETVYILEHPATILYTKE